jgi:hypothetical protein
VAYVLSGCWYLSKRPGPTVDYTHSEALLRSNTASFRQASDAVVTDATACVGGVTLALAKQVGRVQAVETDNLR